MPSNRRTLLRRGLPCILGALTGCTTNDSAPETQSTAGESTQSSPSGRTQYTQTKSETTSVESTMEAATKEDGRRAVTFNHRKRVVDEGVQDASTRYYSRVFRSEDETRRLDVANARNDFFEQDLTEVEQFVTDTDFEATNLLLVQTEVPSPNYELEFHPLGPTKRMNQVIVQITRGNPEGSGMAVSTGLKRIQKREIDTVDVSMVDMVEAYESEPLRRIETFSLPDETLFESVDVGPYAINEHLERSVGAILADADLADRFTPDDSSYVEFVGNTDFEESYVVAVEATMPDSGYVMIPQSCETNGSTIDMDIGQHNFGGALNAQYNHLLLTRIPGTSPPERGTATIRIYDIEDGSTLDEHQVELTRNPDEWPTPGE